MCINSLDHHNHRRRGSHRVVVVLVDDFADASLSLCVHDIWLIIVDYFDSHRALWLRTQHIHTA